MMVSSPTMIEGNGMSRQHYSPTFNSSPLIHAHPAFPSTRPMQIKSSIKLIEFDDDEAVVKLVWDLNLMKRW
jgi:hypothetical protein